MSNSDKLIEEAHRLLDRNWTGSSTRPAPRLYPHQWSWDSAFIGIGNAGRSPDRAMTELRSLLAGQWGTGLVPHIVFASELDDYFPSAPFWDSRSCDGAPVGSATSGICQPPVHAMAAGIIARRVDDGKGFVSSVFEQLTAWHDYLFSARVLVNGLAEIWHPWESGMDNSPAWDEPLAAVDPSPHDLPPYRRVDVSVVAAADRPTAWEYDRYVYLADVLRSRGYVPLDPETLPFRVHDVLFNAVLARSEAELVRLAGMIGADPGIHADRARALSESIHAHLWSESLGMHVDFDVCARALSSVPIAGGFCALLAAPPASVAARVVETLRGVLRDAGEGASILPSLPVGHRGFEPTRYWRGPVWINIMWLVALALAETGHPELAERLRRGIRTLVDNGGFFEYFDPLTGAGHGSDDFSWTAALLIAASEEASPAGRTARTPDGSAR